MKIKRFDTRWLAVFLLVVSVAVQPLGAAGPDYDVIADNLVNQSVGVQPSEIVLISGNPDQLELMAAVQVAVLKAGGQPIVTLNMPEANLRAIMEVSEENLRRLPTANYLLARMVDVTINVASVQNPRLFADVPEERLKASREAAAPLAGALNALRTRNASLGQTGGIPTEAYAQSQGASYGEMTEIFWAAVTVPPADLAMRAEKMASSLSGGAKVHLTSEAGSDLTFVLDRVPPRINAGRTSDVSSPSGPSSVWFPAGETYTCIKAGSATGTLVVPSMSFRGSNIEQLELKFEGGALTHSSAGSGMEALQAFLGSISDESKQLSIVSFGVNPESRAPSNSSYSSWEMGGMVTLVTGNNSWGGGDNQAEAGLTFHLPGSSVEVGGTQVVKAGALGP